MGYQGVPVNSKHWNLQDYRRAGIARHILMDMKSRIILIFAHFYLYTDS
jgi:hypothetical protein